MKLKNRKNTLPAIFRRVVTLSALTLTSFPAFPGEENPIRDDYLDGLRSIQIPQEGPNDLSWNIYRKRGVNGVLVQVETGKLDEELVRASIPDLLYNGFNLAIIQKRGNVTSDGALHLITVSRMVRDIHYRFINQKKVLLIEGKDFTGVASTLLTKEGRVDGLIVRNADPFQKEIIESMGLLQRTGAPLPATLFLWESERQKLSFETHYRKNMEPLFSSRNIPIHITREENSDPGSVIPWNNPRFQLFLHNCRREMKWWPIKYVFEGGCKGHRAGSMDVDTGGGFASSGEKNTICPLFLKLGDGKLLRANRKEGESCYYRGERESQDYYCLFQ